MQNSGIEPWKAGLSFLALSIGLIMMAISGKSGRNKVVATVDPFWSCWTSAFDKIYSGVNIMDSAVIRVNTYLYWAGFALGILAFSIAIMIFLSQLF